MGRPQCRRPYCSAGRALQAAQSHWARWRRVRSWHGGRRGLRGRAASRSGGGGPRLACTGRRRGDRRSARPAVLGMAVGLGSTSASLTTRRPASPVPRHGCGEGRAHRPTAMAGALARPRHGTQRVTSRQQAGRGKAAGTPPPKHARSGEQGTRSQHSPDGARGGGRSRQLGHTHCGRRSSDLAGGSVSSGCLGHLRGGKGGQGVSAPAQARVRGSECAARMQATQPRPPHSPRDSTPARWCLLSLLHCDPG